MSGCAAPVAGRPTVKESPGWGSAFVASHSTRILTGSSTWAPAPGISTPSLSERTSGLIETSMSGLAAASAGAAE